MTELSSHQVTSSLGSTPSIFEVLAEESLATSLRDAFRHTSKILAENFPHKFGVAYQYFEELYALVDCALQFIHFRMYGASFPERFYGLRRLPDARSDSISNRRVLMMAALQTIFPYMKLKLEVLFKDIKESEFSGSLNQYKDVIKQLAMIYRTIYPWLHFSWEILLLGYYLSYALNKTVYHSPLLHAIAAKLTHAGNEDFPSNTWDEKISMQKGILFRLIWKMAKVGVGSMTLGISVSAVVVQFLEWWYNREGGSSALFSMPIPPPPPKWPVVLSPQICPICMKARTNDTVLSCSGFVFCYPCIFRHLQRKSHCPVTGYSASTDQLIKIYHQGDA